MPTYDYACPDCGPFEAFRALSMRNEPCSCPACGAGSARVLISAPHLTCVPGDTRRAMEINERAQHEPRSSRDGPGAYARMRHPSGCGCCTAPSKRGATVTSAAGSKMFPTKRPWMISH